MRKVKEPLLLQKTVTKTKVSMVLADTEMPPSENITLKGLMKIKKEYLIREARDQSMADFFFFFWDWMFFKWDQISFFLLRDAV